MKNKILSIVILISLAYFILGSHSVYAAFRATEGISGLTVFPVQNNNFQGVSLNGTLFNPPSLLVNLSINITVSAVQIIAGNYSLLNVTAVRLTSLGAVPLDVNSTTYNATVYDSSFNTSLVQNRTNFLLSLPASAFIAGNYSLVNITVRVNLTTTTATNLSSLSEVILVYHNLAPSLQSYYMVPNNGLIRKGGTITFHAGWTDYGNSVLYNGTVDDNAAAWINSRASVDNITMWVCDSASSTALGCSATTLCNANSTNFNTTVSCDFTTSLSTTSGLKNAFLFLYDHNNTVANLTGNVQYRVANNYDPQQELAQQYLSKTEEGKTLAISTAQGAQSGFLSNILGSATNGNYFGFIPPVIFWFVIGIIVVALVRGRMRKS